LFRTLADIKNRNSAQVDAMLGLRFVKGRVTGEKLTEDSAGIQINGRPVGD